MKIYEQDIQMWQTTVAHHRSQIVKATPAQEKEYEAKWHAALMVLQALQNYARVVESFEPANPAASEPFDG